MMINLITFIFKIEPTSLFVDVVHVIYSLIYRFFVLFYTDTISRLSTSHLLQKVFNIEKESSHT